MPRRLRSSRRRSAKTRARCRRLRLPVGHDTVYLTAADADGMMVSMIQSNFRGFGSGIVIPGTGISMQNRGSGFVLDPSHPNCVGPRKRPYHTIIPGFVTQNGAAAHELRRDGRTHAAPGSRADGQSHLRPSAESAGSIGRTALARVPGFQRRPRDRLSDVGRRTARGARPRRSTRPARSHVRRRAVDLQAATTAIAPRRIIARKDSRSVSERPSEVCRCTIPCRRRSRRPHASRARMRSLISSVPTSSSSSDCPTRKLRRISIGAPVDRRIRRCVDRPRSPTRRRVTTSSPRMSTLISNETLRSHSTSRCTSTCSRR